MGRMASIEWSVIRDQWVNRRLAGEQLSLTDLARERGLSYETLRKRAGSDDWQGHLERLQARVSARVAEQTAIDHVKIRLGLLDLKSRCELVVKDMIDMFSERVAHEAAKPVQDRGWHPSAGDVARLTGAAAKLAMVGGGLPKSCDPIQDAVHEEIILNREQQRELSRIARGWRKYGEKHGVAKLLGRGDDDGPGEGEAEDRDLDS